MSKFKARPESPAPPDPQALAAFVAAADQRSTAPARALVVPAPAAIEEPPRIALVPNATDAAPEPAGPRRARRPPSGEAAPWEKHDRDARPLSGINVRLNEYEHELLKYLADADDRSLQQTIKRLLIPAAEAAARKARRGE